MLSGYLIYDPFAEGMQDERTKAHRLCKMYNDTFDTETEKQIQDSLAALSHERTTIAIAHRLSTLRNATRLVVLDRGKIAEIGTHDELIAKEGIYYNLVMAQREMSKMA